jgi:hypothetical protein
MAGLGAARLAATAGVNSSAAKKRKRGKKRRRRNANTCPEDRKNAVCHCPYGLGGVGCRILCVGTGGGHENDPFDCMCAGSIQGVPACDPGSGRCPQDPERLESCGGPTTCAGTCTKAGDCPFNSVPGCTCNTATAQCHLPPVTCSGACAAQATCTVLGPGCVCRTVPGNCGACVPDGSPAGGPTECCSGQFCPTAGLCGQCVPVTCAGGCADQPTCSGRGGTLCVCLGLDNPTSATCGQCIPDASPTSRPDECCSGQYCLRDRLCGLCPAQVCAGTCASTPECQLRGGATCTCVGGSCQDEMPPAPKPHWKKRTCPANYNGLAQSPCNGKCRCKGGRRCQKGRCCERKGTHCDGDAECCSGTCKTLHDNHRQCV